MLHAALAAAFALGILAGPLAAAAQAAGKSYRIGFLALTPGEDTTSMKALVERLDELSYHQGKNLTFEYRSAEGRPERLSQLATELVEARPDVLIAGFGTLTAQAAKTPVLWHGSTAGVPSSCRVRRQDPEGCQACRPPGRAAHQVRARHQPQDRQGAWPCNPSGALVDRGRGDPVTPATSPVR